MQSAMKFFDLTGRAASTYRVPYTGPESSAPASTPARTPENTLRVELEKLHEEGIGFEAIEKAWPRLGHADRNVRYAARVAIEHQDADPWSTLGAAIALARMGGKEHQQALNHELARTLIALNDSAEVVKTPRVKVPTTVRAISEPTRHTRLIPAPTLPPLGGIMSKAGITSFSSLTS